MFGWQLEKTLCVVYQKLKIEQIWRIVAQIVPTPLYQNLGNN